MSGTINNRIRVESYCEMVRFMRPAYSKTEATFCRTFIEPVFGTPDFVGNYMLQIGDDPQVMFAAHSDTVHSKGGKQRIQMNGDIVGLHPKSKSNCLGADCTTGIWIILEMIRAGVPGKYAIFAAEEIGCRGSADFAHYGKSELAGINSVISFDRKGYDSIITHQCGLRTASDEFAESLAAILGMPMKPDSGGAYTDSNEFASIIPECTNVSVGYFAQHTHKETQDVRHMLQLADACIAADWSQLVIARDPNAISERDWGGAYRPALYGHNSQSPSFDDMWGADYPDDECLSDFVYRNSEEVADWLESNGISLADLKRELQRGFFL